MGPEGITLVNSPITTFQQSLTHSTLVPKLATRLHHLHCHIALDCPIGIIVSIELVSSKGRVTSVISAKPPSVRETRTHRSDPRDTWVR